MYRVALDTHAGFSEFRDAARNLLTAGIEPDNVVWDRDATPDLFGATPPQAQTQPGMTVAAGFIELAEDAVCHRDPERFSLLYRLLWRLAHGERSLLLVASDPLVHRLRLMQKAVRRDAHKMTAFLRFRRVEDDRGERFIAWFEPDHHILRRVAPFFVDRFASMRWSILTPGGSLHWDGVLTEGAAISRHDAPREDAWDDWWKVYYRSTFNPARANPSALRAEMPKKYWHNLPEAALIPDLLAQAESRTDRMIAAEPQTPRQAKPWTPSAPEQHQAGTIATLKAEALACKRCPLWRTATQTVFGEGPSDAAVMFVGEQPGDQEDLAGQPFVGPAGQLFDRALAEAGIERGRIYVTNAVKHFKYEPRGKRRIHQKPNAGEIEHCRWWLEQEIALIQPELIVAMGATAVRALTGRDATISRLRGKPTAFRNGRRGLVTVHPSYLLRLPDAAARQHEYGRFVGDLRVVAEHVPAVQRAA